MSIFDVKTDHLRTPILDHFLTALCKVGKTPKELGREHDVRVRGVMEGLRGWSAKGGYCVFAKGGPNSTHVGGEWPISSMKRCRKVDETGRKCRQNGVKTVSKLAKMASKLARMCQKDPMKQGKRADDTKRPVETGTRADDTKRPVETGPELYAKGGGGT